MKRYCVPFVLSSLLAFATLFPTSASAQTFQPVKHSEYQLVTSTGSSAWSPALYGGSYDGNGLYAIEMIGVVINNPLDMLDYRLEDENHNPVAKPQWQIFIQSIAPNDFGGTAVYMGRYAPWGTNLYPNDGDWTHEMDRLNYPNDSSKQYTALQYGDVVKVQALAPGLFYAGKNNINEKHSNSTLNDFTITILERNTTPTVQNITLADLKNPDDTFIFDETRTTGCEHYQGTLVHLEGLTIVDASKWTLENRYDPVVVKQIVDGHELTFELVLGLDKNLRNIGYDLTATPFNLTAILNQEVNYKAGENDMQGYELWLTNASGLTVVPEPGCLALLTGGLVAGIFAWRRRRGTLA